MILLDDIEEKIWITQSGFTFYLTYDDVDGYRRRFTKINVARSIYKYGESGGVSLSSILQASDTLH